MLDSGLRRNDECKNNYWTINKKLWPMLLALAMMICLFTTTTYGGNKKMEQQPLYDFKDSMTIDPQIYKINRASSLNLFPVPFDNAVGTNDMTNAVTILSFPEGKLREDRYFKNAVSDIGGSGVFLPVISKDTIGFALGRLFLLFNFKTKKHEAYRIVFSIDKTIREIAIADAAKKRFIFEIEAMSGKSVDHNDYTNILQLIDLSEGKVKLVKEMDIGQVTVFTASTDKVFLYNLETEKMQVYNMNLESSHHPLEEIVKHNKGKVDFTRLVLHPTLPFAILYAGEKGSTYISWGEGRDKTPHRLFSGAIQFSFSPDGKWVVFRQGGAVEQNKTYLMPVSEKYPNYLGTPILLRKDYFNTNTFAWTNNPVSFVGADRDLFRWELTKEAQKIGKDGDNYPTFHDYIVAKDLEKLTKEKKQGLGKK